ncbi:hypothetical protein [Halocatena marina]|uniref:hypothetical protein n=1 Tax=Halocatena marina TaxID=2934937 RepID=UPI00200D3FE7|nr:hypothetical protein [Halocatena marina]
MSTAGTPLDTSLYDQFDGARWFVDGLAFPDNDNENPFTRFFPPKPDAIDSFLTIS